MKRAGLRLVGFLLAGLLWAGMWNGYGVQNESAPPEGNGTTASKEREGFTVRIGVEEVRLDAVVLDWKGRQIADLKAGDFEIYQDGKLQSVLSSEYIVDHQAMPRIERQGETPAEIPAPQLTKEAVRRTFVFLVDDLSMGPQGVHNARMCLDRFIDNQMQPGDLVSIMQTKGGDAGLMAFSSDKRALKAKASEVLWTGEILSSTGIPVSTGVPGFMALPYVIRALEEMPGRKYIMLISSRLASAGGDSTFDMVADQALRAGVVIHTLDVLGVVDYQSTYSLAVNSKGFVQMNEIPQDHGSQYEAARINQALRRATSRPISLAAKTGGVHLSNNFFVSGIGAVEEDLKGYYLLSYTPPESTFEADGRDAYHKVRIRVKRAGAEVHTRDGFYGSAGTRAFPENQESQLTKILHSPFKHHDLNLSLESGYIDDRPKGYVVHAWLYVDGEAVGIAEREDGARSISLEAAAAVSDIHGVVHDSGNMRLDMPVNQADIEWIRENGVKFALSLPAKKPGAYFVRVAAKDSVSGATGSAYQFVQIPDLGKKGIALSSIFVLHQNEPHPWMQSGESEQRSPHRTSRKSDAFRRYRPPDSIEYGAIVYNGQSKKGAPPDLESQFVLFRNGFEVLRSEPAHVDVSGVTDFSKITIRQTLRLDAAIDPGDYVVQLRVSDRREEGRRAAQSLDFRVVAPENAPGGASSIQQTYLKARGKSVIQMSAEELQQSYPAELSHVQFDGNQERLPEMLERVGENVAAFFREFPNTSSRERVVLQRFLFNRGERGRERGSSRSQPVHAGGMAVRLKQEYSYLITSGSGADGSGLQEDRADLQNRPIGKGGIPGFIMSSGHAGKSLYLHPGRRQNSEFRIVGREKRSPHEYVVAFAQKPQAGDYLASYSESDSNRPVRYLVQGFAWVHPESFQVTRMYTGMLAPEKMTTLKDAITDIHYGKVRFDGKGEEFWLPKRITVSWTFPRSETQDFVYWNEHTYSDYHLFGVKSDYQIEEPGKARDDAR